MEHVRTPLAQNEMPPTERAFRKFHRENPHVYVTLLNLTEDLHKAGFDRIGMKMLFEVLRWQMMLKTKSDDFKLNNNYCSYYARLLMHRRKKLRGVFEVRAQDHTFDPATVLD